MKYFLFFLLGLILTALAQTPEDFYPHHLGDMWLYTEYDPYTPPPYGKFYTEVIVDSILPDGNKFIKFRYFNSDRAQYLSGTIIDSLYNVYEITPNDTFLLLKLNASEGEWWYMIPPDSNSSDFAVVKCIFVGTVSIFNEIREAKIFEFYSIYSDLPPGMDTMLVARRYYARGIGLYYEEVEPFGGVANILDGAFIDSSVIGNFTFPTLSIGSENEVSINEYHLYPNFPNPFNPTTAIAFDLPKESRVRLVVYDISGRQIRTLVSEQMPAGSHQVIWDATDDTGRPVASGVYLYRLTAGDFVKTRKMMLIR